MGAAARRQTLAKSEKVAAAAFSAQKKRPKGRFFYYFYFNTIGIYNKRPVIFKIYPLLFIKSNLSFKKFKYLSAHHHFP